MTTWDESQALGKSLKALLEAENTQQFVGRNAHNPLRRPQTTSASYNPIFASQKKKIHGGRCLCFYPGESRDPATGQAFCHIDTLPAADSY